MDSLSERTGLLAKGYPDVKKVAISYSGGLDSVVIGTLLSKAGFSVCPVVVDIGQDSDFERIKKNAEKMFGSCTVTDARDALLQNISKGIKANCLFEGNINANGLSRPALAFALATSAKKLGCQAIAHGSSGLGNDHLVMENALRVLAPEMRIIAPVRDLDLKRDESIAFAKKQKLITNLARAEGFSADENLWARTIRQGSAVDPSQGLPEEAFKWTVSAQKAPNEPVQIEIGFSSGIPSFASVDGKRCNGLGEILKCLNNLGGKHGIGRLDTLDDKVIGLKVREVYECPAALILLTAHRELEAITLTTRELEAKREIDEMWNGLVHKGFWYSRLRNALDAFIDYASRPVDGTVSLQLYKGGVSLKGRKSRHALYDTRLSSRDSKGVFSQKDTRHFAKLYGLQDIIAYMLEQD